MDDDDIKKLSRVIANLMEQVSDFAPEFATLSDDALGALRAQQENLASDAQFKADACDAALRLRHLKRVVSVVQC